MNEQVASDIDRRRLSALLPMAEAEGALLHQQQLLHSILSSLPEQVLVLDNCGRIVLTNSAWERYRQEQASPDSLHTPTHGDNFIDFLVGRHHPFAGRLLLGICDVMDLRKLQFSFEYRDDSLDSHDWFSLKVTPWLGAAGGVVISQTDISRSKRLSAEHERLIALAENTSDLIAISDIDGRISYLNQAGRTFFGRAAMDPRGEFQTLAWLSAMQPLLTEQGQWSGESSLTRQDGVEVPVLMVLLAHCDRQGNISHISGIARDISELRRSAVELENRNAALVALNQQLAEMQDQLLQSEKLASLGQLAAGVAHEINNPIGYVNSNLASLSNYLQRLFRLIGSYESVLDKLADDDCKAAVQAEREALDYAFLRDDLTALLDESLEGVTRVKKIVEDLKGFSRTCSEADWEEADLHAGLDSTLNIVQNELRYKAEVVKAYGQLPKVECMLPHLNQVFMNMLINASHAIEDVGTIWIRTDILGEEVCVEIRDNGSGIAPQHLSRIFDPFYTTKPIGKGTGLGLSLSYGIVKKHHGRIDVESQPGQGSTFRIWLPIRQNSPAAAQSPARQGEAPTSAA
ncbi:PAS domain S-box protein [Chitinimonas arctica]|uniref:histidine kinase n=1 Tax=Chitinimonas arctica TaxID=2594795 RepID=A0A516SA18_9NEIS|nr:ATP-binding protein [Chitinimonas arctica]QDQ24990.1 PAS domain S-box protein [Chitinimonas arctica]